MQPDEASTTTSAKKKPGFGCVFAVAGLHLLITVVVFMSAVTSAINAATRPSGGSDTSPDIIYWVLNPLVGLFLFLTRSDTIPNHALYILLTLGSSVLYGVVVSRLFGFLVRPADAQNTNRVA